MNIYIQTKVLKRFQEEPNKSGLVNHLLVKYYDEGAVPGTFDDWPSQVKGLKDAAYTQDPKLKGQVQHNRPIRTKQDAEKAIERARGSDEFKPGGINLCPHGQVKGSCMIKGCKYGRKI